MKYYPPVNANGANQFDNYSEKFHYTSDSVYPIPLTKTNKYRSYIHYALAKYQ